MSISRDGDLITFECDGERCNEFLDPVSYSFSYAMTIFHDENWKARKLEGEWKHFCPSCFEDFSLEKRQEMFRLAEKLKGS